MKTTLDTSHMITTTIFFNTNTTFWAGSLLNNKKNKINKINKIINKINKNKKENKNKNGLP